ncbi:MBG domain-containing protein, partial [Levilactobacillus zymae]|uniref:MBG domain-containing protein n=1 Tax=Levilactobacillus zymae TaxID=267363 RepID=UPI003FCCC29C
MKQKAQQQLTKKNFILYKSRTGWKVKARLFGGLVVAISAATIAGWTTPVTAQAATAPTTEQVAPQSAAPVASAPAAPTPAGQNTPNQNPTQAAPANSSAAQPAPLLASAPQPETTTTTEPDATPAETPTAATAKTYPVLTPDQDVNVGVDQSQVSLTADQIASHFTAKVENRDGSDQDANPTKNTTTQTIGKDGTVALTSNEVHTYYNSWGGSSNVQGHQSAHVSFEHEIDFSHNFSMSGALGIGTRTSGGADSVGFIFAPGDPAKATQGGSGGNLGIGGLANAFGFVYDEYANVNDYNDPTDASGNWQPYVGWRTTDASGRLQRPADTDWEAASQVGLNDRQVNPLNEFTMDYDSTTQQLTVVLDSGKFTRHIADISTGYSISVAASTGGSWNDYSARIDKFSYTPKTIPLTVKLVDSADNDAPLDKTAVTAVANIGDTISVFSTQAAAARAVAAGEVDPSLVTVLPTDSAGNVYVVDGTQGTTSTGTAHTVDGDSTIADGTYYTYTVKDGDGQTMTVPVRLAYQAVVTPVDAKTGQPIAGLQPQTVTTVAGQPVIVQIPGYTPTKVVLATPADGEKTAYANLPIDQTTTQPATTTTTDTAAPITHYYRGSGTTVDGQTVPFTKTAGTGQAIAGETVQQTPKDDTTTTNTYYWSTVGTAAATDSTDKAQPQTVATILVPDQATLTYWDQQAIKNQTSADEYKAEAQKMHDEFVAISGLTPDQISSADALLSTVAGIYNNVSTSNGAAKQAFEGAMTATTANEIYTGGQDGYAALRKAQNLLIEFKADLQQLTTKNQDAQNMLASLPSWSETYNQPERTGHMVALGEGFGTQLTANQIAQLNTYFMYYLVQQETSTLVATPKNVGTYKVTLSDAGRDYLKSLAPDQANAGLFVPGLLTIKAQATTATVNAAQVTYGQMPDATTLGGTAAEHPFQASWLEIWDATDQKIVTAAAGLQVAHQYVLRYSAAAQATLEQDKNYNWKFDTAALTVDPLAVTVTAQDHGKTYGTTADPTLDLTSDSAKVLKNGDQLSALGVTLVRDSGETAGTYDIRLQSFNNSNYQVALDNRGKFTIVAKPLALIADNSTKVYGEADPDLTFHLDPNKPDNNLVGQDTAAALNVTLKRAKTADLKDSENVGTYAITLAPDDPNNPRNPNYAITLTPGALKIAPRPIVVTVANATKTYGATTDPQFSVAEVKLASSFTGKTTNALVGDDTLEAEFSRDEGETAKQTYAIHLVGIGNPNYQVSSIDGTLTITPRPVTVTINDAQKVYGEADPTWTWTAIDASTSGETLAKLDPNDLGLNFTRKAGETVGAYQIKLKSWENTNYNVTKVTSGDLTITSRPIVVTVANATKTYGAITDPQFSVAEVKLASNFTGKTTNALVGNDTLGAKFSRDEGETAHRAYAIHLDGIGNPNYQVSSVDDGTLTINPRPVTVTVNDAQKVYGEVDPAWTWTATDASTSGETLSKLAPNDLGLNFTRETGETVGTYWITPELKANPNYDVTVAPGTLTISPRSLDLTIADDYKTYGDADPQFNWSVVNTDKSKLPIDRDSLHVVLTRDSGQTVGNAYRIRLASTSNANYVINVVKEGQFIINKRSVTVTIQGASKTYGETDPALGLTTDAQNQLANGDQLSDLGVTITRADGENVGTYLLSGQSNSQ